jgi:hypothetical protein
MGQKLIVFLLLTLLFTSCDDRPLGDVSNFHLVELPINSVEIPNLIPAQTTVAIKVEYIKPTDCHSFSQFRVDRQPSKQVIVLRADVFQGSDCNTINVPTQEFYFYNSRSSGTTEILKFFSGYDSDGSKIYIRKTVTAQ